MGMHGFSANVELEAPALVFSETVVGQFVFPNVNTAICIQFSTTDKRVKLI
jgi:hypothetical protein